MKRMVLFTLLFVIVGAAPANAEDVKHMGCYDNNVLKWPGSISKWDRMDLQYPEYGVDYCEGKNFDYAGWLGNWIFCGSEPNDAALADPAKCDDICDGCGPGYENDCSSGDRCGGNGFLSIYTRADRTPPQPPPPPQGGYKWTKVPGLAHDIGVDANGVPWIIGTKKVPGGYEIFRWNGSGWTNVGGGAIRIAVGAAGMPWIVNEYGDIYNWTGSAWQQVDGRARDVGVSPNGSVWVIGWDKVHGGYSCYSRTGNNWNRSGGALNIALDPVGTPWVVNEYNDIFRQVSGVWEKLPGKGHDIGVGPGGTAWLIGTNRYNGGYEIFRWTGGNWSPIPGGALRLAVGGNGTPWVVNNRGNIFWGASTD
ncbi:tectonin domain-containing protein [Thermodesulfobacteriota bacterium]